MAAITRVFSRTGDDITRAFPDLADNVRGGAVLDGELLVGADFQPLDFNCLQQRLNRKTPLKSHLSTYPAFVRAYDMLFDGDEDIRALPLVARRRRLAAWLTANSQSRIDLSATVRFADWDHLAALRATGTNSGGHERVDAQARRQRLCRGPAERFVVQMETRPESG